MICQGITEYVVRMCSPLNELNKINNNDLLIFSSKTTLGRVVFFIPFRLCGYLI